MSTSTAAWAPHTSPAASTAGATVTELRTPSGERSSGPTAAQLSFGWYLSIVKRRASLGMNALLRSPHLPPVTEPHVCHPQVGGSRLAHGHGGALGGPGHGAHRAALSAETTRLGRAMLGAMLEELHICSSHAGLMSGSARWRVSSVGAGRQISRCGLTVQARRRRCRALDSFVAVRWAGPRCSLCGTSSWCALAVALGSWSSVVAELVVWSATDCV